VIAGPERHRRGTIAAQAGRQPSERLSSFRGHARRLAVEIVVSAVETCGRLESAPRFCSLLSTRRAYCGFTMRYDPIMSKSFLSGYLLPYYEIYEEKEGECQELKTAFLSHCQGYHLIPLSPPSHFITYSQRM
jgi:hypothetical protein